MRKTNIFFQSFLLRSTLVIQQRYQMQCQYQPEITINHLTLLTVTECNYVQPLISLVYRLSH